MRILSEMEMSSVAGGIIKSPWMPQYQQDEKDQEEQNRETERHLDKLLEQTSREAQRECRGRVKSVEVSTDGNGGGSASYTCKPDPSP